MTVIPRSLGTVHWVFCDDLIPRLLISNLFEFNEVDDNPELFFGGDVSAMSDGGGCFCVDNSSDFPIRADAHGSGSGAGLEGAHPKSTFGGSARVSSDENGLSKSGRICLCHDRSRLHGGLPRHSSQVRINELNVMRFTFLPLTISSIFSPPQSSMG